MFFDQFIKACKAYGKRQSNVLGELGIPKSNGTNWKNGITPTAATRKLLAEYFNVPVEWFNGDDPFPSVLDTKKEPDTSTVSSSVIEFAIRYDSLSVADKHRVLEYMALLQLAERERSKAPLENEPNP